MELTPTRFAVLWIAGAIVTIVGLALLTGTTLRNHGWFGYLRLVREGTMTRGTVVRTQPANHCLVKYSFDIEGRTYSGVGNSCGSRVGQRVDVTYLIAGPEHSSLGSARERLENELRTFALGGLIFPPLVILSLARMRKARPGRTGVA
jgi:hypothetical protein